MGTMVQPKAIRRPSYFATLRVQSLVRGGNLLLDARIVGRCRSAQPCSSPSSDIRPAIPCLRLAPDHGIPPTAGGRHCTPFSHSNMHGEGYTCHPSSRISRPTSTRPVTINCPNYFCMKKKKHNTTVASAYASPAPARRNCSNATKRPIEGTPTSPCFGGLL